MPRNTALAVALMPAAGFVLTLMVFYPGVMTYDAAWIYADIGEGKLGDWQSPVMTVLWAAIDRLIPGSAGMFLLIAALYWLSFGILSWALARRSRALAVTAPV